MIKNCKNCKWLDVHTDKIEKDETYKCTVEVSIPVLPASITSYMNFNWPPTKVYMKGNSGVDCPLFSIRDNK